MVTAVLLGSPPEASPDWHKVRAQGIGGSEIASVVGLSPWTSAFTLWHRKAGNIGEQQPTDSMSWGKRLEPAVCQRFSEVSGHTDLIPGGMYYHSERRWQIGSPDRLYADGKGFLEAKTADAHDAFEWGDDGSQDVPPYYRCQVLWYGDVFGWNEGDLAVLIGGNDFRSYHLTWVESEAAWLREAGAKFWQSILDNQPPPLDSSDSTYQAVRELHPDIDGTDVALNPILFENYLEACDALATATSAQHLLKTQILEAMGNARRAIVNDVPVLRRQPGRGGNVSLYPIKPRREAA